MAERVSTGGTRTFEWDKKASKLDDERKKEIKRGYAQYQERRKREKRNKIILLTAILIIILIILGIIFLN
jgi:hypothetical protein